MSFKLISFKEIIFKEMLKANAYVIYVSSAKDNLIFFQ